MESGAGWGDGAKVLTALGFAVADDCGKRFAWSNVE